MSEGLPQFSKAEYTADQAPACGACRKPLGERFYRINGQMSVCGACQDALLRKFPRDSHAAFTRALGFGIGAALIGLLLYALLTIATGLVIGIASLGVGFLVGKALVYGSGGVRGRRYQIAAVLLTYFAVSVSAVPIALYQRQAHTRTASASSAFTAVPVGDALRAVGMLTLLGLASPFMDLQNPAHGIIGLVILFVGLRIAWRLTQAPRLDIVGPLSAAAPSAGVI